MIRANLWAVAVTASAALHRVEKVPVLEQFRTGTPVIVKDNIVGTGSVMAAMDTGGTWSQTRFYRVVELP